MASRLGLSEPRDGGACGPPCGRLAGPPLRKLEPRVALPRPWMVQLTREREKIRK
jgi:hypothetical protein